MPPQQQFTDAQRDEIKTIVHEALVDFFKGYGLTGKNVVVTAAVLIGSMTVIVGGVKVILGWLGFQYMMK